MSEQFPLQILLDLAHNRADDAARKLGELISGEHETQRKLELLEAYRAEYQTRFLEAARHGIGPDAWKNYSTFINRLDEAIALQRAEVDRSRLAKTDGQQAWLQERNKLKAIDTLSQRHQAVQNQRTQRAEQRQTDEHAARQHRENSGEND
jgi:flagellar FliJ protein